MMTLYFVMVFILFDGEVAERLVRKERELADSKYALTISQIQPHFIFNCLSTIKYLVRKDQMEAMEQLRKQLRVILAQASCKNISREEIHDMIDTIYNEYGGK